MPGGQAEYLRVPQAQFGPIVVPEGVPDERYLYLSDILPTAWQAVEYAEVGEGDTLAVHGLGPVGLLAARIAKQKGCRVIGVDLVPERLALAAASGVEMITLDEVDDIAEAVLQATGGRGADGTIDAVGMEAHGSPLAKAAITAVGLLPDTIAEKLSDKAAIDRTAALVGAIKSVRRGGTVSVVGVYGGEVDPLPMMEMFDRGITAADGPVPRAPLDRRHPQGPRPGRRRARRGVAGDPPGAPRGGARGVRDVPGEEGRLHQGRAAPVTRVLLVTGASSGIGRAVAERAAERGDALVLVARDPEALEAVAETCRARGAADVRVEPADVGDDDAVARVVAATVDHHGRLDAVVHSAGVVAYGRLEDVPAEVFDGVLRTNVLGAANLARHVLPVLRRQRGGHLVLVGSVLGDIAAPFMTAYVVSKWAIRSLGRQLALENRDLSGVHVSVVSPGGVDTPIYESAANYLGLPGPPAAARDDT